MKTYAIFYDNEIDEIFEMDENEAQAKYKGILLQEVEDPLYNTIDLYELNKVSTYKCNVDDPTLEVKYDDKN